MRKFLLLAIFTLFLSAAAGAEDLSEELVASVERRIAAGLHAGIVIGIVDAEGDRVYGFGRVDLNTDAAPDGDTIYEIGSIGKTFTATLLAEQVLQGKMSLHDPAEDYLPQHVAMPRFAAAEITLEHLATHRSSLPRLPSNFRPANPRNPFADYTLQNLYDYLNSEEIDSAPGSARLYSNVGFGLLGHILELATGQSYDELVRERIAGPLGMASTGITLTAEQQQRFAPPYDATDGKLKPTDQWDVPALAGAGALRSSAVDMLRYLAAELGLRDDNPLAEAMALTQQARGEFVNSGIGLGWSISGSEQRPIYAHNGGTGGYRSFSGFIPAERYGVIVLTNSNQSVDDIGVHLLVDSFPLAH